MVEAQNISVIDRAVEQWRRRKWLFIGSFLAVFTIIFFMVASLPPLYRSSTTVLFTQNDIAESLLQSDDATNELELRLGVIRQAVMSRSQLQEVIDAFNLYAPLRETASMESVVNRFRQDIDIEQRASAEPQWGQRSTYAITITYQAWDPERAALVANELAARYRAEDERIRTSQAERNTAFMREELEAAQARFEIEELRMTEFQNAHMGELPEQQGFNMATLDRLNSQLRLNGERQVHLMERRDAMLAGAPGSAPRASAAGLTGRQRLEWLKRDLAELETRYTSSHPDIIRLKMQIDSLTLDLAGGAEDEAADGRQSAQGPADLEGELRALRREEARLRAEIAAMVQNLEGTPRIEQDLRRLAYEHDTARTEYLSLQKLYKDAQLAESLERRQNQQFKIIEMAIPPDGPVAPDRRRLIFLGFVLALGVAGTVVLLAENLDKSFHSIADIRRFTSVPILATIPTVQTAADRWRRRARFGLVSVVFVAGLLALGISSYWAGAHAEHVVLAIAN